MFDLTASEAAAAVGVCDWKSPYKLWRQKKGHEPEDNFENNPYVQHGIEHEDVARFEFSCFMALELPEYALRQPGLTVYRNDTRFAASLDNLAHGPDFERVVIEYKCPTEPYGTVPHRYMIQIQIQMEFADADVAYFWVWTAKITEYFIVKRNKTFFDKWLFPKMIDFVTKLNDNHDFEPKKMPRGRRNILKKEIESYFPDIYGSV